MEDSRVHIPKRFKLNLILEYNKIMQNTESDVLTVFDELDVVDVVVRSSPIVSRSRHHGSRHSRRRNSMHSRHSVAES
jgi:hypothetical protein